VYFVTFLVIKEMFLA